MYRKLKTLRIVAVALALAGLVVSCAYPIKDPTGGGYHDPNRGEYPDPKKPILEGGLIDDGEAIPISKELTNYLRRNGYASLNLISARGIKIVNIQGKPIPWICKLRNGVVPESCELKGIDIRSIFTTSIIVYKINPLCTSQWVGPYLVRVHTGEGGYTRGAFRCHGPPVH